eukprot:maker-scaffold795_size96016-snap-gene-0.20 protein:Tk10612 transcript:maker-scaffold795_size96016-snap-gene-0.20-mRNA-1 annotation:"PREDICTED: hypothetical protein LOC100741929"
MDRLLWSVLFLPLILGREERFLFPDDKTLGPNDQPLEDTPLIQPWYTPKLPKRRRIEDSNVIVKQEADMADFFESFVLEKEMEIVAMDNTSFCDQGQDDYCEDPQEYPERLVEKIIARLAKEKDPNKNQFFDTKEEALNKGKEAKEEENIVLPFFDSEPRLPRPQTKIHAHIHLDGGPDFADGVRILEDGSGNRPDHDQLGRQGQVQDSASKTVVKEEPEGSAAKGPSTRDPQSRPFKPTLPEVATPRPDEAEAVEKEDTDVPSTASSDQRYEEETPLCSSVSLYIYPKRAQNKDNQYKFIINVPEKSFIQAVRIERCRSPGAECSLQGGLRFSDLGIRTVCRQKFIHRRMLALNDQGDEEVDLFKFPSCCVCHQIELTPFSKCITCTMPN